MIGKIISQGSEKRNEIVWHENIRGMDMKLMDSI